MLSKEKLKIEDISIILEIIMVNFGHIGKNIKLIFDDSQNFAPKDRKGTKPTASEWHHDTDEEFFDDYRKDHHDSYYYKSVLSFGLTVYLWERQTLIIVLRQNRYNRSN